MFSGILIDERDDVPMEKTGAASIIKWQLMMVTYLEC